MTSNSFQLIREEIHNILLNALAKESNEEKIAIDSAKFDDFQSKLKLQK